MASTELTIVNRSFCHSAPTGEGERFQTSDGRWWKSLPVSNIQPDATGREVRWIVGDKLVPYNMTCAPRRSP